MNDWPDLAGRLVTGGHALALRVYYEDTDFSGVVYHANYLRFFERGRSDFLRLRGIGHRELAAGVHGTPLAFVVRAMELDFLKPARIDDLLIVDTRFEAISGARMVLAQKILRGDEVLVTAGVTIALIDPTTGRPQRIPAAVREKLEAAD
ncbi:tol-pal system-associated acyl-CoA thioesterase [Segnochrobactraceae bacterium EtOH-i3]